ncbi:zinc finger and BTB domain-containing protein 40 [Pelobates fuscus]|uniref:zinc finger and BTB domain-containing protein 40 n=1 Tax=Pelobates fuscus TaxID=191477 RepID=UPI002FE4EDEE
MELPNYSRQLLLQLHTLCKEQQFCDCTIFIGALHFRAHKLVLAAASLLFKSLLESTDTISIDASVVTSEEFSLLLEILYSGKLPPGKHNLTKIISVADSLQMFDLAVSCKNLLSEIMSHSTQSQKMKDVSIQPKPVTKTEILPEQDCEAPQNETTDETATIEKITSTISAGSVMISATEETEASNCTKTNLLAKEPKTLMDLSSMDKTVPELSTALVQARDSIQNVVSKVSENELVSSSIVKVDSPVNVDAVSTSESSDILSSSVEAATLPCAPPTLKDDSPHSMEEQPCIEKEIDSFAKLGDCITASTPSSSNQTEQQELEDLAEPSAKKRRYSEQENEKASGELDFLMRYESIFSEALSDPQSVLENLKKCRHLKENEKQVVMECCQAEEGSSTFAKLLEKVKDGQSIVVETVLALLKLCRHTNPSVNELLREKDLTGNDSEVEHSDSADKEKTLFDLLVEHREELVQCITELSPIIECLDTAEEGFLTNIEKQVIIDCCEGGSHKETMDRLLRKVLETKTLSPDSLVKLLQAVREAFPDLHSLLELLEPNSKQSTSKVMLSTADFGLELLRQYQENFCEVVTSSEMVISDISSATNLTAYEIQVLEQIAKKNSNSRIFNTLINSVLDDQTLTVMACWQLLFAMQTTNVSLKSLIEEIRKEPGADAFFLTVSNRENEAADILVRHSDLIVKALGQNNTLESALPEDKALSDLVKELFNTPAESEDNDASFKLLTSALQQNIPVMKFCNLLFTVQDSAPDLQPVIKELEQLGLLMDERSNMQGISKWSVANDFQLVVVEEFGERNDEDEDTKDDENENEEAEAKKEESESTQEKESAGSTKKRYVCQSCDKIFLFRCRLEVHMKRCRMAKRNPLQCKDCNEVLTSRKELDQHREEIHGFATFPRSTKGKRKLLVTCDICGKEFAHPSGLQYHKRTEHFDEKPFSCEECGAKFAANSTLKNHLRLHTGERPFVCKHCHMTFTQAAALSYHTKKKHSEGKMYVCQYCDAVFAQSIELTRHVRTHTGDKPYVCRECGKGFSQANGLSIHLRTFHNIEDPYDCQKCRMSFPTLEENRQHIQVVHSKEYHPCPTCEKIFSAPSLLERHIVTHVGGKPYNCEICDKAYQQLSGLWYHNRTHHPDLFAAQNHRSSKFSVQCSTCDQFFSNPSILQKHALLEHADGKLYECDKCKQTYPSPAALQVHIKCKHSGSQPFQCLYCTDSFQFPGALQHHVATQHFSETESTFGCELCGELFTNQTQLERHYETEHLTETESTDGQVVQVIQGEDQVSSTEQVITLDESHLAGSQVIVALPDSQNSQNATELVAVSMEDLLDGTVTLICGDSVTGVTQRTQS